MLQTVKNLIDIIDWKGRADRQPSEEDELKLTCGIPARYMTYNDPETGETIEVLGISQQELLKFLRDNNFEQTPVHMRK